MSVRRAKIKVGDRIIVPLKGLGDYMATVKMISKLGVWFKFDRCLAANLKCSRQADAENWARNVLIPAFPDDIGKRLGFVTVDDGGGRLSSKMDFSFKFLLRGIS